MREIIFYPIEGNIIKFTINAKWGDPLPDCVIINKTKYFLNREWSCYDEVEETVTFEEFKEKYI